MESIEDHIVCRLIHSPQDSLEIITNKSKESDENVTIKLHCLVSLLSNGSTLFNSYDVSKITVINLSGCNLSSLPSALRKLNLRELRLAHNSFKEVPTCLYAGLNSLKVLDLSFNQLQNFDVEPQCHSALECLNLNDNKLYNLPSWILVLRAGNLKQLDYSGNKLLGEVKCLLQYDLKLNTLSMRNCTLRNIDISFFKSIITLTKLDISNEFDKTALMNTFDDLDELFVKVLWKDLQILNLNNLSLSTPPEGIAWLDTLREVHLVRNNLSWLPDGMEYLVNLEVLDVSHNQLTYLPARLFLLVSLEVFNVSYNKLYEFGDITQMYYLETLDVYCNNLTECTFYSKTLKYVDMECNLFDTGSCEFYEDYVEKKIKYRNHFNYERVDGRQYIVEGSVRASSSSASSDDEDLLCQNDDTDLSRNDEDPDSFNENEGTKEELEENWDEVEEDGFKERNREITASDDEWQGEINMPKNKVQNLNGYKKKVYNDDWMFCDAEEAPLLDPS